ncbi:MAG: glycosyl transferase [Chloroflexota bacterium]|nr:glycosyltransferase family 4 protein [Ardenticatenaceae bacterium]GIK57625.1 MAG: glycosyl transferase [Chloroflexota bacterium]
MKIGIDARFLTHPQAGGFKTYTNSLINALSQVDSVNDYIIYVDRAPAEELLPQPDNFTYKIVDGTMPGIGMPFREQILLKRQIETDQPHIVHFLCNTAPVGLKRKFVVTLHDTIQVTDPEPFKLTPNLARQKRSVIMAYSRWAIVKTAQAAQKVITVSNFEKNEIIRQLGLDPDRVCVTHLAPDPVFQRADEGVKEEWRAEVHHKYGLSRPFVLGVGYEPRKNTPLLIDAFAQLVNSHPERDLVVVAANEARRHYFQQLASEQHLTGRVTILPALSLKELAVLYNLAEVFVFPSERESFGLPPLEALACGTPAIAMNMTSLPEILGDGAMLVNGKDVQTWANAIDQVLRDNHLRQDLAQRGLQHAARLTWQRCAHKTVWIYQAVIEETQLLLR